MIESEFKKSFISARRKAIAAEFSYLNDMQLQGVLTTEGPLLLLAGAGSGKTTVLINRIANLLRFGRGSDCDFVPESATEDDLDFLRDYASTPDACDKERMRRLCAVEPVEPWRVIAITFTNKAADELRARLEAMLGPDAGRDIWARTFHSACVRILRRDIERLGYDRSFTIYDTGDSQSLIKRILKEKEMDDKSYPYRTVLGYISRAKDAMQSAEEFCAEAEKSSDIRKKRIGAAYREYETRLKAANALDFDDIILLTVRLLTDNEDVREHYQRLFKYVLIDEYQDTNNLQYRLAGLLTGSRGNICVVGDDDQSIYKFRGATIENILSFESQYKNTRVIKLEQNYRSTANILAAANDVIANNKGRKGKKLWTEHDPGDKPELYIASNERDEAQYVAARILADAAAGRKWSEHAILYRMNAQSNAVEYALKRSGVPYRVLGGMKFFDRAEIKDILAYLCVINNPTDDLRLLRIINTPPRGIGAKTIETVSAIAESQGIAIYEALGRAPKFPELERAAAKLRQFYELIETLREKCSVMSIDAFYDELIDVTGYMKALNEHESDENIARAENVGELKSNIVNYMKEAEEPSLAGFLDEVALYTDIDSMERGADSVVMMTMHSAKGLEFPVVFIVGAEEGIFPGARVIGEIEEMEEERRLCYVAMTRAKERLFLTCAKQRMMFGRTTAGSVSRFVEEIAEEHITKPTVAPEPESESHPAQFERRGGYSGTYAGGYSRSKTPVRKERSKYAVSFEAPQKQAQKPTLSLQKGDAVEHKAFGRGFVTDIKPSGGDALIEVAFDTIGTKRLMLNTAASFMKKIEG